MCIAKLWKVASEEREIAAAIEDIGSSWVAEVWMLAE